MLGAALEVREARVVASPSAEPAARGQNFSFAHATVIQPSAVWKAWKGTIEGCADSARRSVTCPRDAAHVPTYVNSENALSNSDVSTVAAHAVAARAPDAGHDPQRGHVAAGVVDQREARLGRRAVGIAGEAHPARHRLEHVVVGRLGRAGPVIPNPLSEQQTMPGLSSHRSS